MQGKGIIKLFFWLLLIVTVLQFFFMYPTRKAEKAADEYAEQVASKFSGEEALDAGKAARLSYLDSISSEKIFSIPFFKDFTYDELKNRQLAYGLDLKGGMSAVLQVDLKDLLINLSNSSRDENFRKALDDADAAQQNSQSDYITLFSRAYENLNTDKKLSTIFMRNPGLREDINANTTNGEVARILREKADETVNLTFMRLKQRIDKLGVTQPNVSLDASRDLITVEMPGIENPERARKMLVSAAKLEFWNTYRLSDNNGAIANAITQMDTKLKNLEGGVEETVAEFDTTWTQTLDDLGNPTGDSTFTTVPKQMDPFAQMGPLLSLLQMQPRYSDNVIGLAEKNKKDAIDAMLARPEVQGMLPADLKLLWSNKPVSFEGVEGEDGIEDMYQLYMIKMDPGKESAPLTGDVIVDASQGPNPNGEIAVNLRMDANGTRTWGEMTTAASQGGAREIAIVLDDEVVSAPRVNSPITGGSSEITGNFSVQEASDLSSILEVGKLPAKTSIVQESNVGPSLGKKNINSSMMALAIGFSMLLLFMILYYGGAGIVAIIALLLNLFFIFGALASFGTVLTLPGIAGIILTIGMAVDANVIIFERVREELRAGKSTLASIADGFKNSYSAIIDANVTTILVAMVLAYYGMGPIKGFAVVLIIGVLCSLFTAVLLGKMVIDWWTGRGNDLTFWTSPFKNTMANLNIDWIGKRKFAYMFSGFIIIAGLVSMFTRGFDFGVDFKGGYSYDVVFADDVNVDSETLRNGLANYFGSAPVVKSVDTKNTFNIVTDYRIRESGETVANEVASKLYEGVAALTGISTSKERFLLTDSQGTHITRSSKIGPTIADDIKKSSIYAGIFALLLIFLYIFIRFNRWQFSLGAVAALFHDSLVVLGLFSLLHNIVPFALEVDQAFIAAILTVIAYSINDTVVVFDRIREYLGIYSNKSTDEVLNLAINSTVSRTVITSVTTLVVVLTLFIFGGGSIKGFAFALIIGILVGTYSSIFVATPIVRDLSDDLKPKVTAKKSSFSKASTAR
jgi:SecD/SecF fusion protein